MNLETFLILGYCAFSVLFSLLFLRHFQSALPLERTFGDTVMVGGLFFIIAFCWPLLALGYILGGAIFGLVAKPRC